MKRLLLIFIFFAAAAWLGIHLHADPGYILIAYQKWTIEMPIWFTLLSLLVIFFLLHFLLRFIHYLGEIPRRISQKMVLFNLKRGYHHTTQGFLELMDGQWGKAEKHLAKALNYNHQAPLINYLAAAKAAQELHADERREYYLQQAQLHYPKAKLAVQLAQAQLQLANNQFEQALATLKNLHEAHPSHPHIIKLLQTLYVRFHEWEHLQLLLPTIKKYNLLAKTELAQLTLQTYSGILKKSGQQNEFTHLETVWNNFPRTIKKEPVLIEQYGALLLEQEKIAQAQQLLRAALNQNWQNVTVFRNLVRLYGKTIEPLSINQKPISYLEHGTKKTSDDKQLQYLEYWLTKYPQDAVLLLTLGRICKHKQLWGKAKIYLRNSAAIEENPYTYLELAQLAEQLGEQQEANDYFRKMALAMTATGLAQNRK